MISISDYTAKGKIIAVQDKRVVFRPAGTNYELLLDLRGPAEELHLNALTSVRLRGQARKLMTVPSGGNFLAPIFGSPRIVQGRVLHMVGRTLVVHAGAPFVVDLPVNDAAIDLMRGPIDISVIVNAALLPGATLELLHPAEQIA